MTIIGNTEISVVYSGSIRWRSAGMEGAKVLELDLHRKKLKIMKDLSKLKYLRVLDASCNELSKIQGLSGNKELRELKLYGNCIEVLDGVEKLTELCHLLLHFNKISSIGKGLRNCHKLQVLRLDHNSLEVISGGDLAPCSAALTHLDLGHNQLHTAEGLGSLGNLLELNLENNCLKEAPNLTRCKKLTELNLSSNPIDINTLSASKIPLQLRTLKLASLRLSSLSCLPKLPHLQELHIPHNTLTKMDCHILFPSLEFLNVRDNLLETAQDLGPLGKWVELVELEVEGNPLCSKSGNYRDDVGKLLPKIETLDGVSLVTGVAVETSRVPLMRPLTPSTVGPSLRQVERQLLEAEVHLQNYSSEIAASFEVLRTTVEPPNQRQSEADRTDGREDCCESPCQRPSSTDNHTQVSGPINGDVEAVRDNGMDVQTSSSKSGDVDRDKPLETDVRTRPPTRSGSRARLQEALVYANEKYDDSLIRNTD